MTRRLSATLAAVAFAAGAVLAGPAPAAQAASCEAGAGVTVVVDFAALSGGVSTRCAAGDPDTGVQALTGAGYSPERAVQERSGYFLCRIDGKPASDPCQRAASSSAYWSYWHAKPGGTWSFSNTGPGTFDPAPGSVEGWAYGAGKPPSVAPPAAARPQPAAPPAARPQPAAPPADQPPPAQAPAAQTPASELPRAQAAGSPAPAAKPKPNRTADSRAASSGPAVSPPAETATALGAPETATPPESVSPEPSSSPEASASPEPSTAPDDPEATPTSTRTDGSPAGPLAAALLVLALVTAGGWQLVRRRHEQL